MQLIDMYVNNVTAHKSENFDPNFKLLHFASIYTDSFLLIINFT